MTAMCDVAFLLLSFFILTTKFKPSEAIAVTTPSSVSSKVAPNKDFVLVTIDKDGKVFLTIDDKEKRTLVVNSLNASKNLGVDVAKFKAADFIGASFGELNSFLSVAPENRKGNALPGIPCKDTTNNEMIDWMRAVNEAYAGEKMDLDFAKHAREVDKFVEKPDIERARKYVKSGKYLWNAGMFIAPAALLLKVLSETEPELHGKVMELAEAWGTDSEQKAFDTIWPTLKKIAVDYAVAEPAAEQGLVAVVPAKFGWHDVGDFAAIAELQSGGKRNHLAVLGDVQVLADKSSGILISETGRLVALIGLEDVIIVDTPDALLVTTKAHAQRVKNLVDSLKTTGHSDVL
jgi:hypothetical protein